MITFKKLRAAAKSHGRGMDNTRTAAWYAVHKDGNHIATIRPASSTGVFGGTPSYIIQHPTTYKEIKRTHKGGLSAAKKWAEENHHLWTDATKNDP